MKDAREVVDAHYAASERGDVQGMIADFAADIVWTDAAGFPVGGTFVGVAAVCDHIAHALSKEWHEWTVAIDELVVDGETVVGLGTYSATHKVTGKPVTTRVAHVWRVRDGRATAFEQISDTAAVVKAMK